MTPDQINAVFNLIGGCFLWVNVYRLWRDKRLAGVSPAATAFFSLWGVWSLYFFLYIGAWYSFLGEVNIVVANTVWIAQMVYYGRKAKV